MLLVLLQVGAPADPELDGDSLSPEGSSFSPSPTPRGLLPEGSFVDESGRLVGTAGVAPLGTLGAPRLDARLVAVFSPRSSPAGLSDDMVYNHQCCSQTLAVLLCGYGWIIAFIL